MNKHEVVVNGKKFKRVSLNRKYTHVLVGSDDRGFFPLTWSSSEALARKAHIASRWSWFDNLTSLPVGANVTITPKYKNEIELDGSNFKTSRPAAQRFVAVVLSRSDDRPWSTFAPFHWFTDMAEAKAYELALIGERGFKREEVVLVTVKQEAT